jgi:hypothetical protein
MSRTLFILFTLAVATFAKERCYFMTRMSSPEEPVSLTEKNCAIVKSAFSDMDYFGNSIGEEGNLIIENEGSLLIEKIYNERFSTGTNAFHIYMAGTFLGANPVKCVAATSSGCGALEYVQFGIIIRDFYLKRGW